MGPRFFETIMGRTFFEGQLPSLIRAIEKVGVQIEKTATQQAAMLERFPPPGIEEENFRLREALRIANERNEQLEKDKALLASLAAENINTYRMPEWIVNNLGELGVLVDGQAYFLYKGDSIQYGRTDDGVSMQYRPVHKREFGEVCQPAVFHGPGETDGWRKMPVPTRSAEERLRLKVAREREENAKEEQIANLHREIATLRRRCELHREYEDAVNSSVVHDTSSDAMFHPRHAEGLLGYRCVLKDGTETFITLVPSTGTDDGEPVVFSYFGTTGDPEVDSAMCHCTMDPRKDDDE